MPSNSIVPIFAISQHRLEHGMTWALLSTAGAALRAPVLKLCPKTATAVQVVAEPGNLLAALLCR